MDAHLTAFVHWKGHHHMLKIGKELVDLANEYISLIGALFLVAAALLGILNVILVAVNHVFGTQLASLFPSSAGGAKRKASLSGTRIEMGGLFALGLELLVVTDVLETLVKEMHEFSYELLGKIGAVALVRLVLAYFLGKEVEELKKEEEEETHNEGKIKHSKAKKEE